MFEGLLELTIIFFVIFDPLMSFAVFFTTTEKMERKMRDRTAMLAILVAVSISFSVLILGEDLLKFFSTDIKDLKVAGGIILGILGIKMALGQSTEDKTITDKSAQAIATVIGTPMLTGPAAITTILLSATEYGKITTGLAVGLVLAFTAIIFYLASVINKLVGKTAIQIMSSVLGIISLAWGIMLVRTGLGF